MTDLLDVVSRQLAEAAAQVRPPDPAALEQRLAHGLRRQARRTRRRRVAVACVAILGVLATGIAVRDTGRRPDHSDVATVLGQGVVPSTFHWSPVDPTGALLDATLTTWAGDGSVYAVSSPNYGPNPGRLLYRSSDGVDWTPATLPGGQQTSALAAAGGSLYSIGSAPTGGLVVSRSDDRGTTWTPTAVSAEVAQLKAQYGDRVVLWPPHVAALDATHVVVTITAATNLRVELYRPDVDTHLLPRWDTEGVKLYQQLHPCDGVGGDLATEDQRQANLDCLSSLATDADRGPLVEAYTYDQLGITGALRDLVGGRSLTYASTDGTTFDSVTVPTTGHPDVERLSEGLPLATPDGYVLFTGSADGGTGEVFRSPDGRGWTKAADLDGSPSEVGMLGDRPAVGVWIGQRHVLEVETDDGWTHLDLTDAVAPPDGGYTNLVSLTFGPLGMAAIVASVDQHGHDGPRYLVHTSDGGTLQAEPLTDRFEPGDRAVGVAVTADAIAVRIIGPSPEGSTTLPRSHVLVGTPP